MKRLLKRTLALMLAVLMVAGTLPTSAWAARIVDDPVRETPVLDDNGPVADTLGHPDQGEKPIDPVDPVDPDPADPSWTQWTIRVTKLDSTTGDYEVLVESTGVGNNDSSGKVGFALVPDLKGLVGASTPTQLLDSIITGDSVEDDMVSAIARTRLPLGAQHTNSATFRMGSDGTAVIRGTLDVDALNNLGTVYDAAGNPFDTGSGVPMIAILATQGDNPGVATATATFGGGVGNATWVVNLGDNTVKQMVGDALVDNGGTYAPGTGNLNIPVPNTGNEKVWIGFRSSDSNMPSIVKPDPAWADLQTDDTLTNDQEIEGGTSGNLPLKLKKKEPGVFTISVPHYLKGKDTSGNDEYNLKGTPTITVIVVNENLTAAPMTFKVHVADGVVGIKAGTKGTQSIVVPSEFSALFDNETFGDGITTTVTTGDAYGLSVALGQTVTWTDDEATMADEDCTLVYGTIPGPDGDVTDAATVTLTPSDAFKTMAAGSYPAEIALGNVLDPEIGSHTVTIPITIEVTVEAAQVYYDYTLVYNGNGHTGGTVPAQATYTGTETSHNFTAVGNTGSLVKTGHTFLGWADSATATTAQYTAGSSILGVPNGTKTVYAVWEQNTYTIKWNIGYTGGTNPNDTTGHYGDTLTPPTVTRTGWSFGGWKDASGNAPTATIVGNAAYTAQWTQNKHKVTYNFGTVTPTGVTLPIQADVAEGASFDVSTALKTDGTVYTTAAGLGYTFTGWSDGTNTRAPGASVTMGTSDITLTAQWSPKNYTVTYSRGSIPAANVTVPTAATVQHGANHTVAGSPLNSGVTGWQFKHWQDSATSAAAGTTLSNVTANHTLTAQWRVQVSYALDGGTLTGYPASHWVDYNTADANFPGNPSKTGYTFDKWTDAAGNTVTSATTFTAPTTVTAQWTQGKSTIHYNWNYTGGTTVDHTGNTSVADTAPTSAPSRTGYTWDGNWYAEAACTNRVTTFTFPAAVNDEVTYYAKWTANEHTVTYAPGVATGATIADANKTQTVHYDDTNVAVKKSDIITGTATGWNFVDWLSGSTHYAGDGSGSIAKITGNMTLTAQWTMDISFNWNLPTGETTSTAVPTTQKIAKGGTITVPNGTTLTNYTFDGWYTVATATGGTKVSSTTTFNEPTTLYARWTYDITYDVNWPAGYEGTKPNTPSSFTGTAGGTQTTAPNLTPTYYTLSSWNTAADGTGTTVNVGAAVPEGTKTLYARWTQKTATVTVNFKKTDVGGSAADFAVTGAASLGGALTANAANANSVTINNVPWSATAYDLTFAGVDTTVNVTVNAAAVTATVDFYQMQAVSGGNGTATVTAGTGALVMTDAGAVTTTKTASTTTSTPASIIVMKGGKVDWSQSAATNYTFSHWDTVGTTTAPSVASASGAAKHTANFSKENFDTYLDVTVNGDAVTSANRYGSGKDVTAIKLVGASATTDLGKTITYESGHWTVKGLSLATENNLRWEVSTADGGKYYTTIAGDGNTATETLFGITIEGGVGGNNSTNAPTLKAQTASNAATRIVTRKGNASTVALNKIHTDYAFDSYLAGNATAPTAALTAAQGSGSATAFTLAAAYAAPANHADLYLKPVYTFSATVKTQYGSTDTAPGGNVKLVDSAGADFGSAWTAASNTVTGLTPGETYTVWVNGFESATTVTAPGTAAVTLRKLTGAAQDDSNATTGGGTVTLKIGANGPSGASVYVPTGATTAGNKGETITATAAASSGYRLRNKTTYSADTATWSKTENALVWTLGTAATQDFTLNNLTADATVNGHFVQQFTASVSVDPTKGGSATFIGKPDNTGTSIGSPATSATVDKGDYVVAKFVSSIGNALDSWTVTNGELWASADRTTGNALAIGNASGTTFTSTLETVYFFPTATNATLVANTVAATYPVTVKVNLDNGAYASRKVELREGSSTVKYTLDPGTNAGEYTKRVLPGTYNIYVDGVTTNTMADTGKDLAFTAAEAEGKAADGSALTGDALAAAQAKLAAEVNYYTVNLAANPAGGGTVNFTGGTTTSKIVLATGSTQALAVQSTPNDAVNAHYRYNNWTATAGTAPTAQNGNYTLPAESTLKAKTGDDFNITSDKQITVTAHFVKQFKVTVQLANSSLGSSMTAQIKKTGETNWASVNNVLVDEGSSATVGKTADPTHWFFKDWTIQSGAGSFANPNKGGAATVGYEGEDTFTPTADSVLVLNMWQDAALSGDGWTYEKGAGTSSGTNVGKLNWTANDAQTPKSITIQGRNTGTAKTLGASDYSVSSGVYTLATSFLNGLDVDTYDVTFTYDLGTPANHKNVYADQTKPAVFGISSTAYKLTEVNIQAEDKTSATVNPNVTSRDAAVYKDHTVAAPNIKHSDLTFIWYYNTTAPAQKAYNDKAAALAAVPAGSTEITAGVTAWTDGTNTVTTGTAAVTAAMKGGYIFAVVHTPEDSETAAGAVITNAILVDYDAEITVNEDDAAIAAAGNYSVYLWPSDGGTFSAATAVATTFTGGKFVTQNSALTGGKSYDVYAKTVEGGTAYQKVNGITVTRTSNTATVKYYTVNAFTTAHKHAGASQELGEPFASTPATRFAVKGGAANNESVASGTAVLSGTTVTASASAAWTQDYKWNWGSVADSNNAGTNTAPTSLTYGTEGQGTGAATKDYAIAETRWVGGQMEQRTYTITGDVKSTSGVGKIATATLTSGTHTFTGTFDNSGQAPATVTFTGVPRNVAGSAVGEHYTISATPGDNTTIMGYSAPAATALPATSNPDEVTVAPDATTGRFTIFVAATLKTLTVNDADNTDHKAQASGTGNQSTTHTDTGKFANYTWANKTVTITNNGNTPLVVTLTINKGASSIYTGSEDTSGTLDNGEVTITGLGQLTGGKVTLQPGEHKDFGIATVSTLNAYDDDTYQFVFTSTDARTGFTDQNGPTVTYNYTTVIDPVTIKTVKADLQADGSYKVIDFTIVETNGKALLTEGAKATNAAADPTSGDLIYTWYVGEWNDDVTLSGGVPKYKSGPKQGNTLPLGTGTFADNGKTYTPDPTERGKALYLVLKGRGGSNATGAAMTPNVDEGDPVVLVPYQGVVQIHEDDVLVDVDTNAANYTVELRRKGAPAGTPAIATTWNDTLKGFVTDITDEDGQLWARDPDDNTSAAWEYEVWASRVKGNTTLQDTGLTITVADKDQVVDFYKVQIDPTTVTQGIYEGKITPANTGIFLTTPPTAQPTAATATGGITVPDDGFVQKGNNVTFTYPDWVKDYKLTWGGAASGTADPGAARTASVTYSAKVTNAVTTNLDLKTYNVVAHVTGTVGWVDELTMEVEGHTFTTKADETGKIVGNNTTADNLTAATQYRIAVGKNVTFYLPKADYTTIATVTMTDVKSWTYQYDGASSDGATTANILVHVTGTAADDTYTINLIGDGLSMQVGETALPTDRTSGTAKNAQGSIPDGGDVTTGTINQEIHLNYHYADNQTVTLDVTNISVEGRTIYNVTRGTETKNHINSSEFATIASLNSGAKQSMTLTIDDDLPAGSYGYSTRFTFANAASGADVKTSYVDYNLTVVVDPLPFTAVTTKPGTTAGTHTVNTYTVQPAPTGAAAITDTTISPAGADANTNLTHGTDYAYKWVRTAMDVTLTNADLTWAGGTPTLPSTAKDCNGSGYNTPTYTPNAADQGQKLYLVIYANNNTNASGAAISDPITTGYTGRIKVHVNGTQVTGTTAPNPGYTVRFVPSDNTKPTVTGTWNNATDNTAGYVATLDPEVDHYTVQVSRARGDATNLITLNGVTITNGHRDDDAYYFTVTAKDFATKDYITGSTGETFAPTDKQFDMTIGSGANVAVLTSGTPVLSGQSVAAKAKGWGQDYKLTWQSDSDTDNVSVTTGTVTAANQQTSAVASADGAFTQTVTAETYIGGRLDQNTYTLTGHIKNPNGKTGGATSKVELAFAPETGDGRTFTLTANSNAGDHKFNDVNADGNLGNAGDTVTFTVVKGAYAITATEGTDTVISAVTIGVDNVVHPTEINTSTTWADRNKENLTPAVTGEGRIFNIYLEGRGLALKVADGHTGHEATSTSTNNNQRATHTAVYYFNGVDTTAIPLTLSNPGNAQLTVSGAVTKVTSLTGVDFAAGTGLGSAPAAGDKVTVTGLPTNGTLAVGGTLAGGSVSVAANAANTDDGIYIVRFTSQTTDTAGTPVTGPTVYYVFDLTVKPLPIQTVAAERLADGKLQLKDYAAGTADSGLANITVAYNDAGDTAAANAKDLHDSDFSYIWAKAKPGVPVDASKFDLTAGGMAVKSSVTDVTVLSSGTGYNTRQFTPADTDQGMNFYLIAYRSADTANASEFAVSDAVYAQVTVEMKAYRTGTATEITDSRNGDAKITGTLDGTDQSSQSGSFTVTGDGTTISFAANEADDTDPAKAKYYFMSWDADPTGGVAVDANDRLAMTYSVTQKAKVIGYYDLLPSLAGSSVGYNIDATATTGNQKTDRTLIYTHNDGSGTVKVYIKPATGNTFLDGSTTPIELTSLLLEETPATMGADGNYVLKDDWIKNTLGEGSYIITFFDTVEGATTDGATANAGGYAGYDRSIEYNIVAGEKTVTARVKNDGSNDTPVYNGQVQVTNTATTGNDGGKGTTSTLATNGGSVTIEAFPNDGYVFEKWVQIDPAAGTFGDDADAKTTYKPKNLNETVEASFLPADYTVTEGKAKVYYGNTAFEANTATETENLVNIAVTPGVNTQSFTYSLLDEAELTAYLASKSLTRTDKMYTTDGYTSGTDTLGKIPGWLDFDTSTGVVSVKAGEKATGVNVRKNGTNDVTDELIVYVKVEEGHTHATKIVPFTVDIMTTPLKIVTNQTADSTVQKDNEKTAEGAAYKAAYVGAYGSDGTAPDAAKVDGDAATGKIIHGGDVELGKFAFTSVVSTKNATDELITAGTATDTVTGLGTWAVAPTKFNGGGTDPDQNSATYTFTFTYTGVADDPSDDYNYAGSAVDAVIPVQRPARSLEFGDALKVAGDLKVGTEYSAPWTTGEALPTALDYTTNTFRKGETLTYLDGEPTYTVKLKRVGSLQNITLTVDPEDGKTTAGFKTPNDLAAIAAKLNSDGAETTFELTLAPVHDNVWVGEHYIRFKLSGKDDLGADVTAYYTVSLTVAPKTITALDVKVTDPDTTPTEVKGTTDDNKPVDNKTPDGKENVPIKNVTVTWGPDPAGPDGKHTEVTITVETDPNYIYVPDDPTDPDQNIDKHTEVTVKETVEGGGTTNRPTPTPYVTRDSDTKVTITQPIPYLMHSDLKDGSDPADATGPKVNDSRTVSVMQGAKDLGSYTIDLGAYGGDVHNVEWTIGQDTITSLAGENGIGATLGALPSTIAKIEKDGAKQQVVLDLTTADTSKPGTYSLTLVAKGKADPADGPDEIIQSTYTFQLTIRSPGGGGPVEPPCPCKVLYYVGSHGVTEDATIEDVSEKNRPSKIPSVTPLDGYVFRGWSLTNPATLKSGEKLTLVDPKTVEAKGETMTFYAVIVARAFHEHYVIGYPNGNFGPADNINRASVATIIARAILPDFVEGANYGNPGNYNDVSGHWAESAIAYCSKFGVFEGYTDGTFRPDQPITRQEFALVIARLDGVMTPGKMDFTDIDEAGEWALGGIYTAYAKGWINGYTDGTFKPLNNIRRDEAVKVFNAYLNRGVDADGLRDLHEYVHSGEASNITGNGDDEYMTWADVPKDHWAYYEIVEAANDHEYVMDFESELGYTLPEVWEKCWIDERWRYHDDLNGSGANAALASAAFGVGLH